MTIKMKYFHLLMILFLISTNIYSGIRYQYAHYHQVTVSLIIIEIIKI